MAQRVFKSTWFGWGALALGAALSAACAAVLVMRRKRSVSHGSVDPYEAWWQRRDQIRANGDYTSDLFV